VSIDSCRQRLNVDESEEEEGAKGFGRAAKKTDGSNDENNIFLASQNRGKLIGNGEAKGID
jgi:hypothetical protein